MNSHKELVKNSKESSKIGRRLGVFVAGIAIVISSIAIIKECANQEKATKTEVTTTTMTVGDSSSVDVKIGVGPDITIWENASGIPISAETNNNAPPTPVDFENPNYGIYVFAATDPAKLHSIKNLQARLLLEKELDLKPHTWENGQQYSVGPSIYTQKSSPSKS
jgi:hypothetical protein